MKLNELKIGEKAFITGFSDEVRSIQLMEMGCIPGEIIQLISRAPLGDPLAVMVSGYKLSIRKSEAVNIQVKPMSSENISIPA